MILFKIFPMFIVDLLPALIHLIVFFCAKTTIQFYINGQHTILFLDKALSGNISIKDGEFTLTRTSRVM